MPFDQAIASNFEAMIQIGHSLAYKRPAEPLVITRNRDALMRLPHRRWRRAPREGATVSSKAHRTMATHACSGVGYPRRRWTRERTERLLSKLMAIVECASSTAEEKREVARVAEEKREVARMAVLAATEWAFFRPHAGRLCGRRSPPSPAGSPARGCANAHPRADAQGGHSLFGS
jgi:hypothetical protein